MTVNIYTYGLFVNGLTVQQITKEYLHMNNKFILICGFGGNIHT